MAGMPFPRRRPLGAVLVVVLSFLAGALPLLGREEVALNTGWRFALQPAGGGFSAATFDDRGWTPVTLPHTWNAIDGAEGGSPYVRGDGWYRLHFAADPRWAGQRVFVDFRAANRVAELWLNGIRIGEHRGGYSRFRFDVTDQLKTGSNVLAVRVNNEANGIIPLGGDFTMWGGIPREVSLLIVPPTHLGLADYGSLGVYLTPQAITPERAEVQVRTLVDGAEAAMGEIRVVVRNAEGVGVAEHVEPFQTSPGRTVSVSQAVSVPKPHLWQGRVDPYLYRVSIELRLNGRVTDRVEQPLGLRTVTVDPERGLFLNGRHLAAHGVDRHEDWLDCGNALSPAQRREDFALIEELGANVIRLCHYEHDDYDYQLCDSAGILAWAEVAFVGQAPETAGGNDNAVQQLRELIRQNYNHPAIFCWSVGNETRDGAAPLIARLAAVAKQEDPTRFTTYASHHKDDDPRDFSTDLLGYNRYYGWYTGSYDELGRWLDQWHARNPGRPLGLSEYGAGASIYQHEPHAPPRPRTQARGPWHPEEWQADYHEHAWLTIKARPYLWGTFIWAFADFGSAGRAEGDAAGRNDKGLVTIDRRTKKDAFFWYKANWSDVPFVYIASRRDDVRFTPATAVKIYSNCATVELWVNGASQGVRQSADHRFIWEKVTLDRGPNRLSAVGTAESRRASDSCGWTLVAGTPYRPADDSDSPAGPRR
jgi:beta-galactosidase